MIEKIDISDAVNNLDVIESIRTNIPAAELNKKGLADKTLVGAFQLKTFSLKNGESAKIGKLAGLCTIRHSFSSSEIGAFLIDNHTKSINHISGRPLSSFPMEYSWEGDQYDRELIIKSTYTGTLGTTWFMFAFQIMGN